jgi:hypothetical protein
MRRALIVPLIVVTFAFAAGTPNFSGIWKLDSAKSDFGPQTVPHSAEYIVRHVGSKLSFNYIQDGNITRIDITPDNEERITSTTEESASWTRAYWSGPTLVFETRERRRYGTQAATGASWSSRWTLSPDGQQLIIDRTIRSGTEEFSQHVVFVKQPLKTTTSQDK